MKREKSGLQEALVAVAEYTYPNARFAAVTLQRAELLLREMTERLLVAGAGDVDAGLASLPQNQCVRSMRMAGEQRVKGEERAACALGEHVVRELLPSGHRKPAAGEGETKSVLFLAGAIESYANALCDVAGQATLLSAAASSISPAMLVRGIRNDAHLNELLNAGREAVPEGMYELACTHCNAAVVITVDSVYNGIANPFECDNCK